MPSTSLAKKSERAAVSALVVASEDAVRPCLSSGVWPGQDGAQNVGLLRQVPGGEESAKPDGGPGRAGPARAGVAGGGITGAGLGRGTDRMRRARP